MLSLVELLKIDVQNFQVITHLRMDAIAALWRERHAAHINN